MTIARLIRDRSSPILTCTVETSVREAVPLLAERRIGALPVLKDGIIAGIFSERDALHQLHEQGPAMLDNTVGEAMTAPAISVEPATPILEALGLMTRRRIRHLPVVTDGRMVGFVSIGDLVKYRIDQISSEAEALRGYIQMA